MEEENQENVVEEFKSIKKGRRVTRRKLPIWKRINYLDFLILLIPPFFELLSAFGILVVAFLLLIMIFNFYKLCKMDSEGEKFEKSAISLLRLKFVTLVGAIYNFYSMFRCSCGHHYFSIIWLEFCFILDYIIFHIIKNTISRNSKAKNLIIIAFYFILTIIIYFIVMRLSAVDMNALHLK